MEILSASPEGVAEEPLISETEYGTVRALHERGDEPQADRSRDGAGRQDRASLAAGGLAATAAAGAGSQGGSLGRVSAGSSGGGGFNASVLQPAPTATSSGQLAVTSSSQPKPPHRPHSRPSSFAIASLPVPSHSGHSLAVDGLSGNRALNSGYF